MKKIGILIIAGFFSLVLMGCSQEETKSPSSINNDMSAPSPTPATPTTPSQSNPTPPPVNP